MCLKDNMDFNLFTFGLSLHDPALFHVTSQRVCYKCRNILVHLVSLFVVLAKSLFWNSERKDLVNEILVAHHVLLYIMGKRFLPDDVLCRRIIGIDVNQLPQQHLLVEQITFQALKIVCNRLCNFMIFPVYV